jgi:4-amino-4-deoxy-L-arabinose transferase-like glycosyltransferase
MKRIFLNPDFRKMIPWLLVGTLGAFMFFWGISSYALLNNNEGMYAQIAKEMLHSGNYVIPTLNGLTYIEKPPLLYWMIVLSFKVFGVNEWGARFVPAFFGFMTAMGVGFFAARRLGQKTGLYTTLILSTSLGFILFFRTVFFDGVFTAWLTFALLCFFCWTENLSRRPLLGFYALMALAVMTKGLIALVLVGLVWIFYYALVMRARVSFFAPLDPLGLLLFLGIAAPWHVMASIENADFAWFYFVNEHVLRFLGKRLPKDYYEGPFYYYLPRLLLYFLPWTLFFPRFIQERITRNDPFKLFFLCWFGVFFLFFSFSRAKANYYLVTVMPALSVLLAPLVARDTRQGAAFFWGALVGVGVPLGVWLGLKGVIPFPPQAKDVASFVGETFYLVWSLVGVGLVTLCFVLRTRVLNVRPLLLGGGMATLLGVAGTLMPAVEDQVSGKAMAEFLTQYDAPLYLYRDYEKISAFPFYWDKTVRIVASKSQDLWHAMDKREKPERFPSKTTFALHGGLMVLHKDRLKKFCAAFPRATHLGTKGCLSLYLVPPDQLLRASKFS